MVLLSILPELGAKLHRVEDDGFTAVAIHVDEDLDLTIGLHMRVADVQPHDTIVDALVDELDPERRMRDRAWKRRQSIAVTHSKSIM